ncbi:FUSC family protein [Herbidospora yilanensis]|uniref:FUSC family protein n=1 Tax=Herbidospora yilanensis TaxID=354426 RepID=UPI0007834C90|nr:FUSC family protein [Herbidospora yilanensis]
MTSILRWIGERDPDLNTVRKGARAAVIMPSAFAFSDLVVGNPVMSMYASFGSFALLLMVDFSGSTRDRLTAQFWLVLAGTVLISVGTLASHTVVTAVLATVAVAFLILFSGVVSSVLAGASTALLVSFVLPVTIPAPLSSLDDRLYGWWLVGAASMAAIVLLWPAPTRDPLRPKIARALALLAERIKLEVACLSGGLPLSRNPPLRALADEADEAVHDMKSTFWDTPYRPAGLTTTGRAEVRLAGQVVWLHSVLEREPFDSGPGPIDPAVCAVETAAAEVLVRAAELLDSSGRGDRLDDETRRLMEARQVMEHEVTGARVTGGATAFVASLEPSFRAQEISFAISAITQNVEIALAAEARSWRDRFLGRQPAGFPTRLSSARARVSAHAERHSVWLRNSIRGAVALSISVLVATVIGVEHSFWVVLGTLVVLRSNAVTTGQSALRALAGTAIGFAIGAFVLWAVHGHTVFLWILLPITILIAGLAPTVISFMAGQAGFTVLLLILFEIVAPTGWRTGLIRLEDIAVGCSVSLLAGALFWPRGARAALGQSLDEAFTDSARYFRGAVAFGVTRCDVAAASSHPAETRGQALAAMQRLDDAFRGYLAERGTKHMPLSEASSLVASVTVLQYSAEAIVDLWSRDDGHVDRDRSAAQMEIVTAADPVATWFERAGQALGREAPVPERLPYDQAAEARLIAAVSRDLSDDDGRATATGVRIVWTAHHVDAARRLADGVADVVERIR